MENTKICSKCGRELPLECFCKDKSKKDGLQPYCKECNKQRSKQYYTEHAEAKKQYSKQYYAEHRDERIEKMKQYNADYFKQYYTTIEGYARYIRNNNLQKDRKYGRCGKDEDILPPLEYYIWALQQLDFYDGKQYHWSEMGLDRIYNDKPHTFANVVPCSTVHNIQRGKMNFEEFCAVINKKE